MKRFLLLTLTCLIGYITQAQDARFGATAGATIASAKIETQGFEDSDSQTGFYFGLTADIGLSEKLDLHPELLYLNVDDISFLQVPVFLKFNINESINIQGGPQITYTLEDVDTQDFTKFNIGAGLGLGVNVTEDFFVESRYVLQLNNYFTGSEDFESRINFFNVGIGYRF